MASKYTYSISGAFPNHKVNPTGLLGEIRQSEIITAVSFIGTEGDNCDIWFKAAISGGDKTLLDGVVAAHSGAPSEDITPSIQSDGAQQVAIVGREGTETNWASHKFTDPTTWYGNSVRVTDEALVDSGDGLTWESAHARWVDMTHGRIWDEEALCLDVLHGYAVTVKVDGGDVSQRPPFSPVGTGDCVVDYLLGKVTFKTSQAGKTVTVSYSYATDSVWTLRPYQGYLLDVETAEIQYSQDFVLTGAIVMAYYGNADHFAPGIFPPGTIIELGRQTYNKIHQFIDEALGSFPVIKGPTGGSERGLTSDVYGFPFHYAAVRRLWSKWGMEVRLWVQDWSGDKTVPLGGEHATGTFYCISRTESSL